MQVHNELSDSDSSEEDEDFDFEYDENPEIYEDDECIDEEDWFVSLTIFYNAWAWINLWFFLFKMSRIFFAISYFNKVFQNRFTLIWHFMIFWGFNLHRNNILWFLLLENVFRL